MKYAVDMVSDAMKYTSIFIKICSGIQNLRGEYTDMQTVWRSIKPTLGK
jgi:hypothetical protein